MDGIFSSNDIMAARCVGYALSQGIRIPDQQRVVGYDDIIVSSLIYPPLTTVRQNYKMISATAVRTIVDMANKKTPPEASPIPVELVVRKTT